VITALVVLIATQPGMAGRMLAEHADDGTGRCRSCQWHNRPRPPFPCVLHVHAEAADRLHRDTAALRPSAWDNRS
jgi:hypothetical protein